ncbi:hypothetical protein [Bacillus sp. ISL-7]|uniref:hypothetical protein n=1 Tax=Bacillus sp. ISL-7 TaxID=2819136 RepID=UPI001BE71C91|nr:hypothetical protein [Bacillus sp. ISL-7]MBT2738899.1 hypothetical protein [Bacillus sp. ISL-7]
MKKVKVQPFFNMFRRKRKSRGAMWASLLGIGISAAVFGVTKGKRKDLALPFQNMVKNFTPKTNLNLMDNQAITEFSEELLMSALNKDNKR